MSAEALFWTQAGEAVKKSLPGMIHLFDSFFRRDAVEFRDISQNGTIVERVSLIAALAVACGAISYGIYSLDPFAELQGIMPTPERAVWTALVPLISAFLAYWIVRRTLPQPILPTFLNLGLVTCVAVTVIPGVLSLAGANASALASDIREFRDGRAAGTPAHQIICSNLEENAEISSLMRRLIRNSDQLARNSRMLEANSGALAENAESLRLNGERLAALTVQLHAAGGPERADPALLRDGENTMRDGLAIMKGGWEIRREGVKIRQKGLALVEESLVIHDRLLILERRQATALYRLIGAYPLAAASVVLAIVSGLIMWLFSGITAWKIVVSPQATRKRKYIAGTLLVVVLLLSSVGFGLLRSGIPEVFLQEPPSREMLEARLRIQLALATPMCGPLDDHGI